MPLLAESVFPIFRAFIVSLANRNSVRVYRLGKKEDGSVGNITAALDFSQVFKHRMIIHKVIYWYQAGFTPLEYPGILLLDWFTVVISLEVKTSGIFSVCQTQDQ